MNLIEQYTRTYRKGTEQTYTYRLKAFFKFINKKPKTFLEQEQQHQINDIKYYLAKNKNNYTDSYLAVTIYAIKGFLTEYQKKPDEQFYKHQLKKMNLHPASYIQPLNKNDIQTILSHSSITERTIFLIALSSGIRINAILQLELDDIDLENEPTKIIVPSKITKSKYARITFITPEAKKSLLEYYKVRDKVIKIIKKRTKNEYKSKKPIEEEKRIFPFSYTTLNYKWNRILRDSKLDKRDKTTNFHTIRIHSFKKFFASQLLIAGINEKIIDKLTAHESQLDRTYLTGISEDFLKEQYKKAIPYLTIYGSLENYSSLQEQIIQLQEENKKMKQLIREMDPYIDIGEDRTAKRLKDYWR